MEGRESLTIPIGIGSRSRIMRRKLVELEGLEPSTSPIAIGALSRLSYSSADGALALILDT